METPDFNNGRVYFKQFGAERVNQACQQNIITCVDSDKTEQMANMI